MNNTGSGCYGVLGTPGEGVLGVSSNTSLPAGKFLAPSGGVAIEAQGLAKTYGALRVLDGVDLTVPRGTVLALLGPNGAGKTTTVRILATLLRPDAGRATVAGFDIARERRDVRRSISLTGQNVVVIGGS